jgi:hypothetical protein
MDDNYAPPGMLEQPDNWQTAGPFVNGCLFMIVKFSERLYTSFSNDITKIEVIRLLFKLLII